MKFIDLFLAKLFLTVFSYPKTAAAVCLAAGTVFALAVFRAVADNKRRAAAEETADVLTQALESQPDGYYLWRYNAVGFLSSAGASRRLAVLLNLKDGKSSAFESVLEKLTSDSAELLADELARMRSTGVPFAAEITDGVHFFSVSGRRCLTGKLSPLLDILWFTDVTNERLEKAELTRKNAALTESNATFNTAFNALPFPVWLRGDDLTVKACNKAYATAVHADSPEKAAAGKIELVYEASPRDARVLAASSRASGKERKVREFVVMDGKRRLVEASENPLPTGTIGFVRDVTVEQELKENLDLHVASHNGVLEHLKTAIAVFDADTRLRFYNMSFLNLWNLDDEWLDGAPTYSHFLDTLREKRKLPENRNFADFKARELNLFTTLVSERTDHLHLPNGVTLRRTVSPHPLGGLFISYEDVTDRLSMERSVTVLNETQSTVFNHLREAVLLFDSDGRLKAANAAYRELWSFPEHAPLSVAETMECQKGYFDDAKWPSLKEQMMSVVESHSGDVFQILRPDGKVLEFTAIGVPGGGIFVSYADATNEEKAAADAAEKDKLLKRTKAAAAAIDRLRETFFDRLKALVPTPADDDGRFALDQIPELALIETGSAVLELDSVVLENVLTELIRALRRRAGERGVSVVLKSERDQTPLIVDRKRLKQALFALLDTALNDTPDGAVLTVEVSGGTNGVKPAVSLTRPAGSDSAGADDFEKTAGKGMVEALDGEVSFAETDGARKTVIVLKAK